MSDIKRCALVKAWNEDVKEFSIGMLWMMQGDFFCVDTNDSRFQYVKFENAIEIPDELVVQLESLGVG